MKPVRKSLSVLTFAIAATLALGACSPQPGDQPQDAMGPVPSGSSTAPSEGPRDPARKDAVTTPQAAPVPSENGMSVVDSQSARSDQTYLHDLMQKPAFADAFHAMSGTDKLPDWVQQGGTATPAETVQVNGKPLLAAQACKPHDCPSEQILVLYDQDGGSMQGVFVRNPAAGPDAGADDQAEMTWLGDPDDATKAWLKQQVTSR